MAATIKTWVDNNPPQVNDVDLNGFKQENNLLISSTGESLDTGNNNQTTQAVSAYAAGGSYYSDSGAVNAYTLNPIGSKLAPFTYFEGMRISFIPANTNTGTASINVAGLGVRSLKDFNGQELTASQLQAGQYVSAFYDGTDFRLILHRDTDTFTSENYIINAGFRFAQRGNAFVLTGAQDVYVSDQWGWRQSGGTTEINNLREANPYPSDSGNLTHILRINRTATGGECELYQKIKGVSTGAGRSMSIAIQLPVGVAVDPDTKCDVVLVQHFGTGGTPSADVETTVGELQLDQGYDPQQFVVSLPNISGKTLGTNNDDYLELKLVVSDHLYLIAPTSVSMIQSDQVHFYQKRLESLELQLCEYYCMSTYPIDIIPGTITEEGVVQRWANSSSTNIIDLGTRFQTRMHKSPTITFYSDNSGTPNTIYNNTQGVDISVSATPNAISAIYSGAPQQIGGPAIVVGELLTMHYLAEATL